MSKHTPGPWEATISGTIVFDGGSIGEAYDWNPGYHSDDIHPLPVGANARLMAAAPEMLEILEDIIGFDSKEKYRAKRRAYELIRELKTA